MKLKPNPLKDRILNRLQSLMTSYDSKADSMDQATQLLSIREARTMARVCEQAIAIVKQEFAK